MIAFGPDPTLPLPGSPPRGPRACPGPLLVAEGVGGGAVGLWGGIIIAPISTGAWRPKGRCPASRQLHLTVVLRKTEAQRAALERAFWDVSTPSHPRYGQHLSQRDVTDLVAPPIQSAAKGL